MPADLLDYGEVVECLTAIDGGWSGLDAVVHSDAARSRKT
jgi:hypothetical protein